MLSNFRAELKNVLNDRGAELHRPARHPVLTPVILSLVSIFPRHRVCAAERESRVRNSIWCLPSQVLTGRPVCQTRAKFPPFSPPSRGPLSCCVCVHACVCVCVSLTLERKNPRKQAAPIFARRAASVPPRRRSLPPFPSSVRRISRLPPSRPLCAILCAVPPTSTRGHFRTRRRHVRPSAFFSLFASSARRLPTLLPRYRRRSSVRPPSCPLARPRRCFSWHGISDTARGVSLQPALLEFSGDSRESNVPVSEYYTSCFIAPPWSNSRLSAFRGEIGLPRADVTSLRFAWRLLIRIKSSELHYDRPPLIRSESERYRVADSYVIFTITLDPFFLRNERAHIHACLLEVERKRERGRRSPLPSAIHTFA